MKTRCSHRLSRVISERNWDRLTSMIVQEAKTLSAKQIVVGLPRNMDGSEGESVPKTHARLLSS
jgi:putative holliday junction resolvase